MVRQAHAALLLAAGLAAARSQGSDASGADLRHRLTELRRQLDKGGERLEGLGRQLADGPIYTGGSLYPVGSQRGYTPQEKLSGATKHMWLLFCGVLVFFMNVGLAMLKAGSSRVKNTQHVFVLCLWNICIGTIVWWVVGWSFAMTGPYNSGGTKEAKMLGYESFAGHFFVRDRPNDGQLEPTENMAMWFFTWAVSTLVTSIASGGVLERNLVGCAVHGFLSAFVIVPIVIAWTWGRGWLQEINSLGYMDMAGSGVVHVTAGFSALAGAIIAGPRSGRFDEMSLKERLFEIPDLYIPHSQPLVVFGTLATWFGWYGLNCGFVNGMDSVENGMLAALVAMNTTIAAAAGGLTAFFIQLGLKQKNDLGGLCFGILSGLVAISASCASVDSGFACLIGVIAGITYPVISVLMKALKIDDPVDAFAVHGVCGVWGIYALPFFDWGKGFQTFHGTLGFRCWPGGTCYQDGTRAVLSVLDTNSAAVFAIMAWSFGLSAIIFGVTRLAKCLMHKPEDDDIGIDRIRHIPEKAYSFGIPTAADFSVNMI